MRKVWQQLKREGYVIARCTVARLMQKLGIQGVWRGKNKQTTRSRDDQKRADDLVKRNFNADHPIPPLLLMCSQEQLLDGKYRHG